MTERHRLGHRGRARDRFLKHGASVLEDYELMELFLFYSVPVKDTKGMAKGILEKFSTLGEIFSQEASALVTVNGIGEHSAQLVRSAREVFELCRNEAENDTEISTAPDYHTLGRLFTELYKGKKQPLILMVSYDNAMNVIGVDEAYSLPFSSGGVKASRFIEIAVGRRASVVAIAFNHPTGPLFPFPSEVETGKMLESNFERTGILLAEQYLISGDGYLGTMQHMDMAFAQRSPEVKQFLMSRPVVSSDSTRMCGQQKTSHKRRGREISALSAVLSFVKCEDSRMVAEKLISGFGALRAVLEADFAQLVRVSESRGVATFIHLLGALYARCFTERLRVGKKCTECDLTEFAKGIFFGVPYEETHLLCFDNDGKYIGQSRISDGTVNSTELLPRKILDTAYGMGAASVALMHNHPGGIPEPSEADRENTDFIADLLLRMGIGIRGHYIVADGLVKNFYEA